MVKKKLSLIENTTNIVQVYVLLNENYVEDDDNMFRFDYRWIDKLIEVFVWIICLVLKKKTAGFNNFSWNAVLSSLVGRCSPLAGSRSGIVGWDLIFLSFLLSIFAPFLLGFILFSPKLSLLSYLKLEVNFQLFVGSSGEKQQAGWFHLCSSGPCSHLHKVQANGESNVIELRLFSQIYFCNTIVLCYILDQAKYYDHLSGGDQLPLRAQETASQEASSSPHQVSLSLIFFCFAQ